jgi:CheY-like chemotaxis protein
LKAGAGKRGKAVENKKMSENLIDLMEQSVFGGKEVLPEEAEEIVWKWVTAGVSSENAGRIFCECLESLAKKYPETGLGGYGNILGSLLAKICDAFSCQKRDGTCPAVAPQGKEAIELHRKVGLVSDSLETSLGSLIDSLQSFRRDSDEPPAEFDTRLSKAVAAAVNTKKLMGKVLGFYRLKIGDLSPSPRFFDAADLAELVIKTFEVEAERRNVKLKNEIPPETDLYADPVLIGYVLHNLASNAVKACDESGMVIMYVPEGESASIAVSDTGKGMEPDTIGRLFEFRQPESGAVADPGPHLELFLSRELMALHKGLLTCRTKHGEGSVFTARLPHMKPRVLLVEDDKSTRELYRLYLEKKKVEIFEAVNGKEGLEMVRKAKPHLVITDLSMPVMDGFTLLKEIKKNPLTMRIPIMVATVHDSPEITSKAYRLGADDIACKPVDMDEFLETVRRIIVREAPSDSLLFGP